MIAVLVAVALAGCGVSFDERPEAVRVPPSAPAAPSPGVGAAEVLDVYFVRGVRLARVERTADAMDGSAALAQLVAGPSRAEVLSHGIRTAVSSRPVSYLSTEDIGPVSVARVGVSSGFTTVSGSSQLLGFAQMVWTLTALPGVDQVVVMVDGVPIAVPTDDGLSDQPVGRDDFLSVAPAGPGGSLTSGARASCADGWTVGRAARVPACRAEDPGQAPGVAPALTSP